MMLLLLVLWSFMANYMQYYCSSPLLYTTIMQNFQSCTYYFSGVHNTFSNTYYELWIQLLVEPLKKALLSYALFWKWNSQWNKSFLSISLHRENLTQLFDQKKSDSSIINKFCYEWGSKVLIDMEQLTSFFGNFKSESSQFKAV